MATGTAGTQTGLAHAEWDGDAVGGVTPCPLVLLTQDGDIQGVTLGHAVPVADPALVVAAVIDPNVPQLQAGPSAQWLP